MKTPFSIILTFIFAFIINFCLPCFAFDPQSAYFSINAETKDINTITDVQRINELLDDLENNWNNHNVEKVLKHYADDFVNGDGLNAEAVKNLTLELWDAYPDVKNKSQERTVRVYGEYATVDSVDLYQGTSSMIRQEVGTKGILKAISIGNLFLKKFGPTWKITSDKTLLEKVSITYGLGSELVDQNRIKLTAPEQAISGQQYTAKLEFNLSGDIKPVAAISKEMLIYPQNTAEDKFRLVNESELEKLVSANKLSKNELITATIGLTGGALKPKLLGLVFLTRRVNVIPVLEQTSEVSIIKAPAKSILNKEVDFLDIYPNEKKQEQNTHKEKDTPKELPSNIEE
ncbi:MAG: hypothetical protein HY094_09845 [Candidatus Melainabacteria bacterium]|nr:hypothetical protein [Candidatus Melainabacteria bacterium]